MTGIMIMPNRKRRAAQSSIANSSRSFCRCLALSSLCLTQQTGLLATVGAFAPTAAPSVLVGREPLIQVNHGAGPLVVMNPPAYATRGSSLLMTATALDWNDIKLTKPIKTTPTKKVKGRPGRKASATRNSSNINSLYQNNMNMYDHRLLTREDEGQLAQEMESGRVLKGRIDAIVASKLLSSGDPEQNKVADSSGYTADELTVTPGSVDVDKEWKNLMRVVERNVPMSDDVDSAANSNPNPYHKSFLSWLRHGSGGDAEASDHALRTRQSYISKVSAKSPYYESPAFLGMLTEHELKTSFALKEGTMAELLQVLTTAHEARQELLKCNMKLVLSIAKRWHANSFAKDTPFSERQDVPSLDELVQEGTVGLIKAVDKFDGGKETRFSTYATYWIQSFVRMSMLRCKTSVLKVPVDLHYLNQKYRALVARIREEGQAQQVSPSFDDDDDDANSSNEGDTYAVLSLEEAALRLKVKPKKLQLAIRAAQPVMSLDGPGRSASTAFKGSAAGGDISGRELTLGDALSSEVHSEIQQPEAYVDLSLLRNSLERVMSAELSPYERDILRLRLGLDDGQTRSIREIADITNTPVNKIFPENQRKGKRIISMSEVRSAEKRAFRKLRDPVTIQSYQLHDFLQAYS